MKDTTVLIVIDSDLFLFNYKSTQVQLFIQIIFCIDKRSGQISLQFQLELE